jgi:hypothetical protein
VFIDYVMQQPAKTLRFDPSPYVCSPATAGL